MDRDEAVSLGEADGEEHAAAVYEDAVCEAMDAGLSNEEALARGMRQLRLAERQGNWDGAARNAGAALERRVPDTFRGAYYSAYDRAARAKTVDLLATLAKINGAE